MTRRTITAAWRTIAWISMALIGAAPAPLLADQPLAISVVRAELSQTSRKLSLTGELVARETLRASFPTGGRIAEIAVNDGDHVDAGAVLARIDRVQQEQALRGARAQLDAAEAEFAAADDNNARQSQLFERGATTRAARNAAADRFAAAAARRAQAEAELEQAHDALDDTVLLATGPATVIRRFAEPGQVVGAAQPILELAQGDSYDAVFDVPEVLVSAAPEEGGPIRLSPLDRPYIVVTGKVREISPLVDPSTGTVQVKITPDARLPGLGYGDAVRGSTERREGQGIVLPWSAMSATRDGPAVWIVDPETSRVALRQIVIRRYSSDAVLIDDGVEPGEIVVRLGAQLLYPGRAVRILESSQ